MIKARRTAPVDAMFWLVHTRAAGGEGRRQLGQARPVLAAHTQTHRPDSYLSPANRACQPDNILRPKRPPSVPTMIQTLQTRARQFIAAAPAWKRLLPPDNIKTTRDSAIRGAWGSEQHHRSHPPPPHGRLR